MDGGVINRGSFALFPLRVESFQVWNAPVASSARAETIRELACDRGLLNREIRLHFSKTHMKAEANMIVGIHCER